MCEHNRFVGAAISAPGRVGIESGREEFREVHNNDRAALKAVAPYAYSTIPTDPRDPYRGCEGRPEESVEVIFTKRKPMIRDPRLHACLEGRSAAKIQNFIRFWTVPRLRASRYDPSLPKSQNSKPGTTRLPGDECSCKEAGALHYLAAQGRLGELSRSLTQLMERGAPLSEKTYLPICILARRLGDHTCARLVLEHAQAAQAIITERLYAETIMALLSTASLEDAESVALRATSQGLLLAAKVRRALEEAGSHTAEQWYARWRLVRLRREEVNSSTTQARVDECAGVSGEDDQRAAVVVTQQDGCNKQVLLDLTSRSPFVGMAVRPQNSPSHRLPIAVGERAQVVRGMVSSVLKKALTALDRLEGIVHADPRGHASLQPRGRVGATANPFPAGEAPSHPTRAILSPRPGPDPEAVNPLEVVGWHLQLTQEEARAVPGTWVPLDQSV